MKAEIGFVRVEAKQQRILRAFDAVRIDGEDDRIPTKFAHIN